MDCEMPNMDGYQATEAIRRIERQHQSIPVVIIGLSAHAIEEYRQKALNSGMDDYLIKPIDKATLEKAINEIIGKQHLGRNKLMNHKVD